MRILRNVSEKWKARRGPGFPYSADHSAEQTGRKGQASGRQQAEGDQRQLHDRCLHMGRIICR